MIVSMSEKNKAGLRAIVEKFAQEIDFLTLDASLFKDVYLRGHILSLATYARVLIPYIIDSHP